ncbi:MAG: NAD-dependent epimerase/dehydratase family protein [Deltaproteobacteria bacterium]
MEKILITGIAGGLGRLIAERLLGSARLVGIDHTPWVGHPPEISIITADLRKRKVEDVFRRERPDVVVHLGLERHSFDAGLRHDVNVIGTKRLLEFCAAYGTARVVILTSSYVYGALAENPFYMDEETSLNVSRHYPEIRDLAEVDALATNFLWRYPEIATAVLRPVSTLGRHMRSSLATYLRLSVSPMVMGFDPLMQFIHEDDLAESIIQAIAAGLRGVFNIVGPGAVPISTAIRESGGTALALPETATRFFLQRLFAWGLFPLPADAVDFIKFPCTIDGRRFQHATGMRPARSLDQAFGCVRQRDAA